MSKVSLLRFHRWLTLVFAAPLLVIIATGLLLSVEPLVTTATSDPGSVFPEHVETLLRRHDPQGTARMIAIRPIEDTLALIDRSGTKAIDLVTGERVQPRFAWSDVFLATRRLHEHLVFEAGWLVSVSTFAMLVVIALGVLMGLPKLRNTVSGWHQGVAWVLLPLSLLSPLTGLAMALGITFATPAPAPAGALPKMTEAVHLIAKGHDLSTLIWLRQRGTSLLARLNEDGEYKVYAVTREGLVLQPRNWPRLIHEGTIGAVSSVANLITSLALLGLLGTGMTLWLRRTLRQRRAVTASAPIAQR